MALIGLALGDIDPNEDPEEYLDDVFHILRLNSSALDRRAAPPQVLKCGLSRYQLTVGSVQALESLPNHPDYGKLLQLATEMGEELGGASPCSS